jgi:2-desacetyl-2-hydroxyethyl bacteriochlorophyllide A dehydrogenase
LFFTAPYQVEIRDLTCQEPAPGEVLVETHFSAISPGTELLVYRGQAPKNLAADANITTLAGNLTFPLQYGYAAVGRVVEVGKGIPGDWIDRLVFSFQPHQTHFTASPDQLITLPSGISPQAGVFLPNMETAVNFVMDGQPIIGERAVIFGQGVVGLLTTALLARFPLAALVTLDVYPNRRAASLNAGADHSYDPTIPTILAKLRGDHGIDLAYEISGSPSALDQAIAVTGFHGRVVVGSWYGSKRADLDLGGSFHRSRIQLVSSQVSSINPTLTGRWDKDRRFKLAWEMVRQVKPQRWITHTLPFQDASRAYTLLDQHPDQVIQVILEYKG